MDELEIDDGGFLEEIKKAEADAGGRVEATVYVDGKPEDYWGVLEYGSTPDSRPWPHSGPKTQRGTGNRTGRIMSKQAPAGFVERNLDKCWKFLSEALVNRIQQKHRGLTRAETVEAVTEAGKRAQNLFIDSAPRDKGTLRNSIKLKVDS